MIRDASRTTYDLFFYCPNEFEYPWTADECLTFERDWPNAKMDYRRKYIPFVVHGTTFSGHPTSTTLCNTLRSICYVLYYVSCAGIDVMFVDFLVSGDDVVIYVVD